MQTRDKDTSLADLKELVRDFRDRRDWAKFHNPKDLAEAIAAEAGELLELFLWQSPDEVARKMRDDAAFARDVEDELADIFIFALTFAVAHNLDVAGIVRAKVAVNEGKYPVAKAKGVATKHTKL